MGDPNKKILVPDLGGATEVDVIEVLISVGDTIAIDESVVTLESDKASMEVPSPYAGVIQSVEVNLGDTITEGSVLATISIADAPTDSETIAEPQSKATDAPVAVVKESAAPSQAVEIPEESSPDSESIYAGPAVRRLARELSVDLASVPATGAKNRVTKDDLQGYVKQRMQSSGGSGLGVAEMPKVDFSQYGAVTKESLTKINRLTGSFLHRNWVSIPHVTQYDDVDITDLEAFRQQQKDSAAAQGVKLTPIVFIMKAVVAALKQYPRFNSSLETDAQSLILKQYYHIGVAVDTPNGLVVPVIRDVDQKGIYELARELGAISLKAREKGLSVNEMQGGCFTISSLGGIGGTAFTPIINAPEVAILGVSRSKMQPVYQNDGSFSPRLMLPLSLSYDHRVIDGADGARFITYLASRLSDLRTLIL